MSWTDIPFVGRVFLGLVVFIVVSGWGSVLAFNTIKIFRVTLRKGEKPEKQEKMGSPATPGKMASAAFASPRVWEPAGNGPTETYTPDGVHYYPTV